jgi:hypothetical protein
LTNQKQDNIIPALIVLHRMNIIITTTIFVVNRRYEDGKVRFFITNR